MFYKFPRSVLILGRLPNFQADKLLTPEHPASNMVSNAHAASTMNAVPVKPLYESTRESMPGNPRNGACPPDLQSAVRANAPRHHQFIERLGSTCAVYTDHYDFGK